MELEDIFAGRSEAVRALHVGDAPAWATLLGHLGGGAEAAPDALIGGMLDFAPGFAGWDVRARAMRGGRKLFWPWVLAGLERSPRRLEPAGLAMRLDVLAAAVADLPRTLALVAEIDRHLPATLEHGRALLLAARRQREAGAADASLGLAGRARALFGALGDDSWHQEARLAEAAAMVLLERLDPALDVVEAELPGPLDRPLLARRRGLFARSAPDDPRALALYELAVIIGEAASLRLGAPIVRALGGVAEHAPTQWPRFERWLGRLAREAPDALDTVVQQASQRGFDRTRDAARAWRLWCAAAAAGPFEASAPPPVPAAPAPVLTSWAARLQRARALRGAGPLLEAWVGALEAFRAQGPPRPRPPPPGSPRLDWAALVARIEPEEADRVRHAVARRVGRHDGDPHALLERIAHRSSRKVLDVHLQLERALSGGRAVELGICDPARHASGFDWEHPPTRFVTELEDALHWTPMVWARSLALHHLARSEVPAWVHLELALARAAGARPAVIRARWSRASVTRAAADAVLTWLGVPTDPCEAPPARPDDALAPVLGLLVAGAALAGADGIAFPETGSVVVLLRDQAQLEPLVAWWDAITDEPLERQVLGEPTPHPVRQGVLRLGPDGAWSVDDEAARWFLEASLAAIAAEPTIVGREVLRQGLAAQLARELGAGLGAGLDEAIAQQTWDAHDSAVRRACLERAADTRIGPLVHAAPPPVAWPRVDGPGDREPIQRFRRLLAPGRHAVRQPPAAPHALDLLLAPPPDLGARLLAGDRWVCAVLGSALAALDGPAPRPFLDALRAHEPDPERWRDVLGGAIHRQLA